MHYDTLLFDVDNTLLDFDANEAESFRCMLRDKGEAYSDELYNTYRMVNEQMWRAIERGEATTSEVVNTRFARLMSKYGKQVDGMEWENCYRSYLNHGIQEMPYVKEVLERLKGKYRLFIITNGMEETQHYRLEGSGLKPYFEDIFISQSVGAGKPSSEFFDYVKDHIRGFDVQRSLVIGDSLTSDILGGQLAGIDTCWFCKEGVDNMLDEDPTFTIHSLRELLTVLDEEQDANS